MNVVSLFGGMETAYQAFKELELKIDNYYSSEIDIYAKGVAKFHFPIIDLDDITKISLETLKILPKIDWILFGSPCQSFSIAGKQEGFNGKSGLFYEAVRIVKYICHYNNPNVKVLMENVVMKKEWQHIITKELELATNRKIYCSKINSSLVSAQNRNRLYWTTFSTTEPKDLNIYIEDIATDINFKSPTLKRLAYIQGRVNKGFSKGVIENLHSKAPCLTAVMYKSLKDQTIKQNGTIRFLTPLECERLQTLPDNFTEFGIIKGRKVKISDTQRYKMIGNGWTLEIIKHLIKNGSTIS